MRFAFDIRHADGGWRTEYRHLATWDEAKQAAVALAEQSGVREVLAVLDWAEGKPDPRVS